MPSDFFSLVRLSLPSQCCRTHSSSFQEGVANRNGPNSIWTQGAWLSVMFNARPPTVNREKRKEIVIGPETHSSPQTGSQSAGSGSECFCCPAINKQSSCEACAHRFWADHRRENYELTWELLIMWHHPWIKWYPDVNPLIWGCCLCQHLLPPAWISTSGTEKLHDFSELSAFNF